ncbi:MAG: preprotein translocase subunit SecE [Nitrospinota bacterium]
MTEWVARARQFFDEVLAEVKKVTWPTRKETIAHTSIVILTVILIAIFLGVVDAGLQRLMGNILR